jgi:hypothetical protein
MTSEKMSEAVQLEIEEMFRMGSVSYADWAGYAWKNELHEQRDRVLGHFRELVGDVETEHNPHHMLERAFSLAAFSMRRLIECRELTDVFCSSELPIFQINRQPTAQSARRSFNSLRSTGGRFFADYDMTSRHPNKKTPKFISDKFVHARFIAIMTNSVHLPNGLLVASDHQAKHSLFHMTIEEYDKIITAFLDDQIYTSSDWIDEAGVMHAERLGMEP